MIIAGIIILGFLWFFMYFQRKHLVNLATTLSENGVTNDLQLTAPILMNILFILQAILFVIVACILVIACLFIF